MTERTDTPGMTLQQHVFAWLGMWRDSMPIEAVGQLQDLLGPLSAPSEKAPTTWDHFHALYRKACESSQPDDWMKAALAAQQVASTLLDKKAPLSATEPLAEVSGGLSPSDLLKSQLAEWFSAYDDGRWDADDVLINVAKLLKIPPPAILACAPTDGSAAPDNAAPQVGAVSSADPATNYGEPAVAAPIARWVDGLCKTCLQHTYSCKCQHPNSATGGMLGFLDRERA